MPGVIDPETLYVGNLPGIWSPVQWELTEDERRKELEEQATASLLWSVDSPEAMLRLLLAEVEIEPSEDPPPRYDPDQQGEWDSSILTFRFKRPLTLVSEERDRDSLIVEYNFGELGHWLFSIEPERVVLERI